MAAKKTQRKAVHLTPRHGHLTHYEAMWFAIRSLGEFTTSQLEDAINSNVANGDNRDMVSTATIKNYVSGLTVAGYLERIDGGSRVKGRGGKFQPSRWRLINDVGIDAPRVTRKGDPVTQGNAQAQMWSAMNILSDFSTADLVNQASGRETKVHPDAAKDYVKHLKAAGYLVCTQEPKPGKPGRARYRLLPSMRTGPKAPMVQRVKRVFDPNLGEVVGGDQ